MLKKIKAWNRRKNYLLKEVKLKIACFFLDHKNKSTYSLSKIKKVLILRDDNKIGDMIVSTSLFRAFHEAGILVQVVSGEDNYSVIEYDTRIDKVYFYQPGLKNVIKLANNLKKENYDLVIDLGDFISMNYFIFVRLIGAKHVLGFNKNDYKIYDLSIDYPFLDAHVTNRYRLAFERLGLPNVDLSYQIEITEDIKNEVRKYLASLGTGPVIVINPFTAHASRDLSELQLVSIIDGIMKQYQEVRIILIGTPERMENISIPGVHKNPFTSFLSAAALIEYSNLVVTPDTSIVHVACAFNKPLVALYGNNIIIGGFINNKVWAPNYDNATQIISLEDKISVITSEEILSEIYKKLRNL